MVNVYNSLSTFYPKCKHFTLKKMKKEQQNTIKVRRNI